VVVVLMGYSGPEDRRGRVEGENCLEVCKFVRIDEVDEDDLH